MKKQTKIGITFAILSVLVIGVGVVFAILGNQIKTTEENQVIIKDSYTNLNADIVEIYQIRTNLTDKLNTFNNETYAEEHDSYVEVLTEYNKEMTSLNANLAILEEKCAIGYEDVQTTIFCSYYQQLYETVNNVYVNNLTDYNNTITSYNDTSETKYDLFNLINKDYIDLNKDGKYDGKES